MQDGVRLRADVFRPARPGRYPTVVVRTPYDRTLGPAFGQQVNALRLAEAGYAVVVQDVRGRFGSEGEFYPFRHEGGDGAETIEWAAGQPWSNGAVGLAGTSYCAYAQALAVSQEPPSLRAWVPGFAPLDARDGWVYSGDAFCLGFNLSWTLAHVAPKDPRTSDPEALLAALDAWPETVRRPPEAQNELRATPAAAYYFDWIARRDEPSYWASLSARELDATSPALVVGGWFDLFAQGTADMWGALGGRPHRLVLGPWDHSPLPLATSAGESEFGSAAALDLNELQRSWFDAHLRGESEPEGASVRAFVTGWNRWEGWDAWPPPHANESWYLRSGGALGEQPAPGEDRFAADAADPTPTLGGPLCCWKGRLPPGQVDQGRRASRSDVLCYASEVLSEELVVAGTVRAEIWSGTSAEGGDVFVTLVDVAPDGRAVNVAEGIRRRRDAGVEAVPFAIDLGPVAHAFVPGHRVRLDVSTMSFPRFDRFPASGHAERTVALGPSRLVLPVATS